MSNDFIPFAVGGSANVTPQATYAANTTLTQGGFQSGLAKSPDLNKVWRQSSIMSAVLAQFIVNQSGQNAVDDGTTATLLANLLAAIRSATKTGVILADTGAVNAYTAVNAPPLVAGTWIDGVVQQVKIAHANTGASTYAPDGLTAIPIYGLGLQPLQGGELLLSGTAILMHATIAGVNSGNPVCVLMECAGGAQQIAPATQSQHAVQMAQAAGVVGSTRNLSMSVTAASATATLTADEIIVETALGGVRYCLPSFSKTINLATTGAGGMDTGTAPVSGYVALYAIWNPTTGTAALLAQNASTLKPNVYGGANMPAGYTASALVGVWPTNASGQFGIGTQLDRTLYIASNTFLATAATQSTYASLSISAVVPANAKSISGNVGITFTTTAGTLLQFQISGSGANGVGYQAVSVGGAASTVNTASGNFVVPLITPQTVFYTNTFSGGTGTSLVAQVSSYTI